MKKNQNGFSLIELLVVIAIIGILASVVTLSVQSSRKKARDAKRVGDIRQLANALESYFSTNNTYPTQTTPATTIPGLDINYIGMIPTAPLPEENNCVGQNSYLYESVDGINYTISFCLGDITGDYSQGMHYLTPQGVQ